MYQKTEQEIMQNWEGNINTPLVSICTITYNHEKYITEALDSFLMQETNFPFEIVVDDDCSTDGAPAVIRKYVEKFPHIIKANLREKNVGMNSNFIGSLQRAKGKYLALCEGDDYWTDVNKLQIQVDFLESHKEYNMVFHNAEIQHHTENGIIIKPFNPEKESRNYTANDIFRTWSVSTASVVTRNEEQYRYLEDNLWFPVGDGPFILKCASLGKVYYMAEQMSVYRRVPTGFMDSGITHTIEFRLTFIKYLKTLYNDFSDLLNKEMMDRKISIQYFWTAYKFKIIGSEENASEYMQHADPQVIFEELIQSKIKEIESLEKRLEVQDKTIHELKEKLKKVESEKNYIL